MLGNEKNKGSNDLNKGCNDIERKKKQRKLNK